MSNSERAKIRYAQHKRFEAIDVPSLKYDVKMTYHIIEFDERR